MTTTNAYPFANHWRRGCWVAEVTGPDREYTYALDFKSGTPHKTSGTVRFTAEDLGAPTFVVAKDAFGVRRLIEATDVGWTDLGEVSAADALAAWKRGALVRCERCGETLDDSDPDDGDPEGRTLCGACLIGETDAARLAEAGAPEPF